jgi:hypothetical protein
MSKDEFLIQLLFYANPANCMFNEDWPRIKVFLIEECKRQLVDVPYWLEEKKG